MSYTAQDFLDPSASIPPGARCEISAWVTEGHKADTRRVYRFAIDPGVYCDVCLAQKLQAVEFADKHRADYLAMVAADMALRAQPGWKPEPYTAEERAIGAQREQEEREAKARARGKSLRDAAERTRWFHERLRLSAEREAERQRWKRPTRDASQPVVCHHPERWVWVDKGERYSKRREKPYTEAELALMTPKARARVMQWAKKAGWLVREDVQEESTIPQTTESPPNTYVQQDVIAPVEDKPMATTYPHELVVYQATHTKSGKAYVGMSTNGYTRWTFHASDIYTDRNPSVYNSEMAQLMRADGQESFVWQVLEVCPDIATLKERELYWIAYRLDRGVKLFNKIGIVAPGKEYGPYGVGNKYIGTTVSPTKTKRSLKKRVVVDATAHAVWVLMHAQGVTMPKIAEAFGVSLGYVHKVVGKHKKPVTE